MEKRALYTKLKASVFKRMKLLAAQEDKKIEQIVEEALQQYLEKKGVPGASDLRSDKDLEEGQMEVQHDAINQ